MSPFLKTFVAIVAAAVAVDGDRIIAADDVVVAVASNIAAFDAS